MNYSKRIHVVEGIDLVKYAKAGMIEHSISHQTWPSSNEEAGLPPSETIAGAFVKGVEVKDNVITLKYNGRLDDYTIIFTPKIEYSWDCTGGSLPKELRPKECR